MIRKLWLIFAQAVTVSAGIAVGLITVTDWRPFAPAQEAVHIPDFSSAVERAAPAVVTIFEPSGRVVGKPRPERWC